MDINKNHIPAALPSLLNTGFKNVIPVLDNKEELEAYQKSVKVPFKLGIRVAAEEEPTFPFYTSRLGIRAKDILEFYVDKIEGNEDKFQLKMLHIFLNKGIKDDIYYWSELNKIINLYCQLKKICPELDSINIGGGFPIKHSLGFEYDYQFMINEIVGNIKKACKKSQSANAEYFYRIWKLYSRRKHGAYLQCDRSERCRTTGKSGI